MTRRTPAQYRWNDLLFDETLLTRHFTPGRPGGSIQYVTIHHMIVDDGHPDKTEALDLCYKIWQTREASAHYGVEDSFVRQYVNDRDTAWSNGNFNSNIRSIAIEHANANPSGRYEVSEKTWKLGAKLTAHICKYYGLGRPVWGKNVRKHSDFSATACPGPFMTGILPNKYIQEAQRVYDSIGKPTPKPVVKTHKVVKGDTLYAIARKYGTTASALQKMNGITNPSLLQIGHVLKVK